MTCGGRSLLEPSPGVAQFTQDRPAISNIKHGVRLHDDRRNTSAHGGVSHTATRRATAGPAIRRAGRPTASRRSDRAGADERGTHTRLPQTRMRAAAQTVAFVLLLRQSA